MAKKIFSIGMVKNEADIIESYVRYNTNIVDGMIILDNGSTDETLKILKKLKSEGLSLFIIEDKDREYEQAVKMNQLLKTAVDEFEADIIVPLDADEFIISTNQGNPREILEKIEFNAFHLVKWKTYVPQFKNEKEKFIPAKITMARDDALEEFYKVIFPKELFTDYNVELGFGNHYLIYDSNYDEIIKHINPDLFIGHFPIRSKEQTISKIVVGWIYSLYTSEKIEGQSFHWKKIFDKIKENKELTDEDVTNFAKNFALKNDKSIINLKEDPMDLTFCKNLDIKYTPNNLNPLSNILDSCEWLSMALFNYKKESIGEEQRLKNKIEDLSQEMHEFHHLRITEKKYLKDKIQQYENSTSWKITAPLRKAGKRIRNLIN